MSRDGASGRSADVIGLFPLVAIPGNAMGEGRRVRPGRSENGHADHHRDPKDNSQALRLATERIPVIRGTNGLLVVQNASCLPVGLPGIGQAASKVSVKAWSRSPRGSPPTLSGKGRVA
jgi:hypothetical protein